MSTLLPQTTQEKFLQFIHDNFSNLKDDTRQASSELYDTLKLWQTLEAKKTVIAAFQTLFEEKRHIETIHLETSWEYDDGSKGYTVYLQAKVSVNPHIAGNYLDQNTEERLVAYEVAVGLIGERLRDLGNIEMCAIAQDLGELTLNNIEHKLSDILYEDEEELLKKIESYEKNILEKNLNALGISAEIKHKTRKI